MCKLEIGSDLILIKIVCLLLIFIHLQPLPQIVFLFKISMPPLIWKFILYCFEFCIPTLSFKKLEQSLMLKLWHYKMWLIQNVYQPLSSGESWIQSLRIGKSRVNTNRLFSISIDYSDQAGSSRFKAGQFGSIWFRFGRFELSHLQFVCVGFGSNCVDWWRVSSGLVQSDEDVSKRVESSNLVESSRIVCNSLGSRRVSVRVWNIWDPNVCEWSKNEDVPHVCVMCRHND